MASVKFHLITLKYPKCLVAKEGYGRRARAGSVLCDFLFAGIEQEARISNSDARTNNKIRDKEKKNVIGDNIENEEVWQEEEDEVDEGNQTRANNNVYMWETNDRQTGL